tara:strand:+ start:636 stop:857 length:222 start_codon:yes stop_codon:yes gene_type:complete
MPPDPKLYCRKCDGLLLEEKKPAPKERKFSCEDCGHGLHLVIATPAAAKAFHQKSDRRLDSSSQPPEERPSTS